MKELGLFKAILLSIIFTLASHSTAVAGKGGSGPGGGYKYEFTVYRHLKTAQMQIDESLQALNQSELDSIAAPFTDEYVEKQKLLKYLYSIDYAELDNGERRDEGRIRDLDYSFNNGGRIILLGPFFKYFDQKELDLRDETILRRKLLHEISHLFKIGIIDNDQSKAFAARLETVLSKIVTNCGGTGTVEERMSDCQLKRFSKNEENFGKVIMSYRNDRLTKSHYALPTIFIHDGRSMFNNFLARIDNVNVIQYNGRPYRTAEEVCSGVNNLDEQISWRAITAEELEKIDLVKNSSQQTSEVYLANGQVRYIKRGGWFSSDEGHVTEITNNKRVYRHDGMQVYCFGSSK